MEDESTIIEEENTALQSKSRTEHLKPWQFKKGQSGNPSGKKPGTVSLKTFAKNYIQSLTDEEKLEFLEGIDKRTVWEMSEGKARQDTVITGNLSISEVLDQLEDGGLTTEKQGVEDESPLQDS